MLGEKKKFFSPAKINLFFSVLKKRDDGYHEIASLLQTVSLGDVLSFSFSSKDSFATTEKKLPTDDSNLVIKALNLFRKKTSIFTPISIHLEKNIPMEAGLGGGSSNAATTLWALKELFNIPLSTIELQEWGSLLGSDVPFFFSHGTAFCTGRGEKVENINIPSFPLWIAKPDFGLSTKKVYENFSLSSEKSHEKDIRTILEGFSQGKFSFHNDLEASAFLLEPRLENFRQNLQKAKFSQVTMTGSGSAFFCFEEKDEKLQENKEKFGKEEKTSREEEKKLEEKKKNIDCGSLVFSKTIKRNETTWY